MKIKNLILVLAILLLGLSEFSFCQTPPPPPTSGHGISGNQQAGSAPIGSGTAFLITLSAVYGIKKMLAARRIPGKI